MLQTIKRPEVLLLSGLNETIQCSMTKQGTYRKDVLKYKAITTYNFIQITHNKYYKFITVDIDDRETFKTFEAIQTFCKYKNIPEPTFIVKTTKGWHIWWSLSTPIFKNNDRQKLFRKCLTDNLNSVFGGDRHSAGFILRNPLTHEHIYSGNEYDYYDFRHLVDFDKIKVVKISKTKRRFRGKKYYNLEETPKGQRNSVLVGYLRQFGFVNFKSLTETKFIEEAKNANNRFPEPQPEGEVVSVAKSVWFFVSQNYNPNKVNSNYTKRNRELAKSKAKKAKENVRNNIKVAIEQGILNYTTLFLNKYSVNALSKIAKVSRNTFKKYKKVIKQVLMMLIVHPEYETENYFDLVINKWDNVPADIYNFAPE